ncbi:MAG: hypothetical protein JETCAE02_29110 [Anaerolineaceae bacterium]|nr:MAG: hypothetical protein JETCAE02_29110 [Anaerolineaceae bacterium]
MEAGTKPIFGSFFRLHYLHPCPFHYEIDPIWSFHYLDVGLVNC